MERTDFSDRFWKVIIRNKRCGYNLNGVRQSACIVINPVTVEKFATLFNCGVDRVSDYVLFGLGC